MKKLMWAFFPLSIFFISAVYFFSGYGDQNIQKDKESFQKEIITVFVTIAPQKYIVSRIAGNKASVFVMTSPGQNPHNYEPLPLQMETLSKTDIFFLIGFGFERGWIEKVKPSHKNIDFVDTSSAVNPRKIEKIQELAGIHKEECEGSDCHHHENDNSDDPHTWLSPENTRKIARLITDKLKSKAPADGDYFEENLALFLKDLDEKDMEIKAAFSKISSKNLMVFHPSWGYFCDYYGLKQIPIEIDGKNPGSKELSSIIEFAKKEKIKVIFIQSQFSTADAKAVAEAIDGIVVSIDPLAENYLENLKTMAFTISGNLNK